MVAWLVEVGSGRRQAHETIEVLASRNVDAVACKMAPPYGLYLADVHFDEQELQEWGKQRSPKGKI
jgi:tRNA U38,U39,U40 pseudouridine synthase TruA